MIPGSPDTPLTAPDMHRLRDTKADGNCLFRAFSVLLTGTEYAHRKVRLAIVKTTNNCLFTIFDCSDHSSMEDYIVAYQMRSCGWGGTTEIFALAHMLGRRVYNSVECLVSRSWNENCPTLIDRSLDSPSRKEALYIYHTGDHYKVVMSVSGST